MRRSMLAAVLVSERVRSLRVPEDLRLAGVLETVLGPATALRCASILAFRAAA